MQQVSSKMQKRIFQLKYLLAICFLLVVGVIIAMYVTNAPSSGPAIRLKGFREAIGMGDLPTQAYYIHPALQATLDLGKTCDFVKRFELQQPHQAMGIGGRPVKRTDRNIHDRTRFTHDNWPNFSKSPYNHPIPESPYDPPYAIQWDFNTTAFLERPDVKGRPPKLITFVVPMGYFPEILDPVRLRSCPEMPCLVSTNKALINSSAALIWNLPRMAESKPPKRTSPDQVFVFHNQERQDPGWIPKDFRSEERKSVFNWTMSFRFDSDIWDVYGYLAKSPFPRAKDYLSIVKKKTDMIVTLISHCPTHSRREKYIQRLQRYVPVHVYGMCGSKKCARDKDSACLKEVETKYKFILAFENSICPDYVTEKFFRYMDKDLVVVARGGTGYERHAPRGTFINVDDFSSIEELVDYLVYLDHNPAAYIKILLAKDCFVSMYEEYPHRHKQTGQIPFVHYHYEAVPMCEMCRRLWNLDSYRKSIPDIMDWYDKGKCLAPTDLH